jgi:hypothetical protein
MSVLTPIILGSSFDMLVCGRPNRVSRHIGKSRQPLESTSALAVLEDVVRDSKWAFCEFLKTIEVPANQLLRAQSKPLNGSK